ncbi:MAG TPA: PH domain-containing protein [Gaiellaceae bacterium]|nr:PH domain-containing protein [Gaiellaceae bacterium]
MSAELEPGEKVRLDERPHRVALVRPLVRPVILAGFGILLLSVRDVHWLVGVGGAALLALAALLAALALLRWLSTRLVLTTERLTVVYGIARRRQASVPLARIPTLELEQTVLGRLLGYGTLVAGDLEVPYVPQARRLRKLLR